MHKYLEHYVSRDDNFYSDTKNYIIAKKLAQVIIDNFIFFTIELSINFF